MKTFFERGTVKKKRVSFLGRYLVEEEVLVAGDRIFDYGCGQGEDLILYGSVLGKENVGGWDAVYRRDNPLRKYDTGFFNAITSHNYINSIPTVEGRRAVCDEVIAHLPSGGTFYIGLMAPWTIRQRAYSHDWEILKDGWVTKQGRFVTALSAADLRDYTEGLTYGGVYALPDSYIFWVRKP